MADRRPALKTATLREGHDLAEDADALIAVSPVVARHFATVAAANEYRKETR